MRPHLLHVFATFAPGGAQVRTTQLIAELGDRLRHTIVAMDGRTDARELLPASAEVAFLDPPRRSGTVRSVRALRRLIRATDADLLLTYNWGAIEAVMAARLGSGPPVVHHEDGFRTDEVSGFKLRRVWARRFLLPRIHAVVVPSMTLMAVARERWRLRGEHVRWIPNGIRPEDFPSADGHPELRARLGIPADAFVVGSVGHLRNEKNPVRLVTAMAGMGRERPVHLLMLGDGPERVAVAAEARARGVEERVHLVGYQDPPQPYYRAMDVFALSSDTEQMPVALLEAMACSLPVVATDVGDVKQMLPRAQSALVAPTTGDAAAALAAALDTLESDAARRSELGRANRLHLEREYSFERMLGAYRGLYTAALATRRGARA